MLATLKARDQASDESVDQAVQADADAVDSGMNAPGSQLDAALTVGGLRAIAGSDSAGSVCSLHPEDATEDAPEDAPEYALARSGPKLQYSLATTTGVTVIGEAGMENCRLNEGVSRRR